MASLAGEADLDSLVGSLMQQLKTNPPEWLTTPQTTPDAATSAAINAIASVQTSNPTSQNETKSHETTEHNEHHQKILQVRKNWPNERPKCTATPTPNWRKIHFVRHGQGTHNLLSQQLGGCSCGPGKDSTKCPYKDEAVADAYLTPLGQEQATKNQSFTATLTDLELIYVSPLSRAIETALLCFPTTTAAFVANENLREQIGNHCCDRRRSIDIIEKEYPTIDFSALETNEDVLWTEERESKISVAERSLAFFNMLKKLQYKEIAVVGHSSWLLTMLNVTLDCGEEKNLEQWFETGELRTIWVDV